MMDISEARDLLQHVPCAQLSYQEWTNVGAALHKEGLPCSLWDEWSQTDGARYHSGVSSPFCLRARRIASG